jgi:hypothetical protein
VPQPPRSWQLLALAGVVVAAAIAAIVSPAITRGSSFHTYADQRTWLGLPHAGDVLSNLPFVLAGAAGLARLAAVASLPSLVFVAIAGVGLGAGAYHVEPSDAALAFDWGPIVLTLAFLAALVIGDRIDRAAGAAAAVVFPAVAITTVAAWYLDGGTGAPPGDMRWYVITQATLVAIVAFGSLIPATTSAPATLHRGWILAGVAGFLAARGLAAADRILLDAVGLSGHSLKHVALGGAALCLVRGVPSARGTRRPPRKGPS